MNGNQRSILHRWGMVVVAGAVALAIAGGGGAASSAASGPTGAGSQAASLGDAPGMDAYKLAAQERASAAAFADIYAAPAGATSAGDLDGPGGQQAPEASCPVLPCFTDVPAGHTFYDFINRIYQEDLVTGYACGGAGEPCDPNNRPYYRPNANVTRGQMSKFIDNGRHLAGIDIDTGFVPIAATSNVANGAGLLAEGTTGDAVGVAAYASGSGGSRDPNSLSAGLWARANGASNSVGAVIRGVNDNGMWVGSGSATYYGLYIIHQEEGFGVGAFGDDPENDSYIGGDLGVGGNCTGCLMASIMQNTGTTDLHAGEVVSLAGLANGPEMLGDKPVVGASSAQGAYSTAVVGVVTSRWIAPDPNAPEGSKARNGYSDRATTVRPGEYMTVATAGAYKQVKVSAAGGAIHVGDLLVASDEAGVAMKADAKQVTFGSVIGKAMGNLESGTGTIPVLITLK